MRFGPTRERALLQNARELQRAIQPLQALSEPRVALRSLRLGKHLLRSSREALDNRGDVQYQKCPPSCDTERAAPRARRLR
jgi:hypothetical protein